MGPHVATPPTATCGGGNGRRRLYPIGDRTTTCPWDSSALRKLQKERYTPLQSSEVHKYAELNRRIGNESYTVRLSFADAKPMYFNSVKATDVSIRLYSDPGRKFVKWAESKESERDIRFSFPIAEPHNWIYPFFSERKPKTFDEHVTEDKALSVSEQNSQLYSKIDRLCTYGHWASADYIRVCTEVFGVAVTTVASKGGKRGGVTVGKTDFVPLTSMGEGAKSLLGLIADLCIAEPGKLFLIEELENDIHPKALKSILEFILSKPEHHQFLISTHSNIVLKNLGVADAAIFSLAVNYPEKLPTSSVQKVENEAPERLGLLSALGYDLFDFELFSAYLLVEESTAERVIRDILIPWFAPGLRNGLKSIAAGGVTKIQPRFEDFLRLFVFIHTSPAYRGKAWVIADGDESGRQVVADLRKTFTDWNPEHFQTLSQANFESYYPPRFKNCQFADKITHLFAAENHPPLR
jgi:hypothetical protein